METTVGNGQLLMNPRTNGGSRPTSASSTPVLTATTTGGGSISSLPSPYMLGGRKLSSSFSDLGDYDEFTELCTTPDKVNMFKPSPIREEAYLDHLVESQHVDGYPHRGLHGSGIKMLPGEILKLRVENAAYIVFYKADNTMSITPSPDLSSSEQLDTTSGSEGEQNTALSPLSNAEGDIAQGLYLIFTIYSSLLLIIIIYLFVFNNFYFFYIFG